MKTVDVVVVGGGPAGAAAAITARTAGLEVLLVERDDTPRPRPGEAVHPGIEPLLDRLDVLHEVQAARFLRHDGHWVKWGGDPIRFVPFGGDARGPWRGFQLWRPRFDAIMLDRAQRAGVILRRSCLDARPIIDRGCVIGVMASSDAVRARIVVDASGRQRWLARVLRLPIDRVGPNRIAWFGYAAGLGPSCDSAPTLIGDADGWTWTARVQEELHQWVHLSHAGIRPPRHWQPDRWSGLRHVEGPRGIDASWTCVRPAAGPGYFLVGDAAFVLDPASSHGVLKALMSGMMVGQCAAAIKRSEVTPEVAASRYDAWIKAWFSADCRELHGRYFHAAKSSPPPMRRRIVVRGLSGALVP